MQNEQQVQSTVPANEPAPAPTKPKAVKRPAAKRATKAAKSKSVDTGNATGDRLVALAKTVSKVKGANAVATLAARLSRASLNHAGLVALRDAVNALAIALREADEQTAARKLAVLNRSVRRLERGGRAK